MTRDKTQMPENTSDRAGRLNKLAYRDGYIYNGGVEDNLQHETHHDRANIRKNDKAAGGVLLGLTITALTALLGGTFFFLMQQYQPSSTSVQTSPASRITQPNTTNQNSSPQTENQTQTDNSGSTR